MKLFIQYSTYYYYMVTETLLTALLSPFKPPAESYTRVAFDVAVALVCMLSLLLCGRSILRGIVLQQVQKVCSDPRKQKESFELQCYNHQFVQNHG